MEGRGGGVPLPCSQKPVGCVPTLTHMNSFYTIPYRYYRVIKKSLCT
jgi:hypothetical protein